MKRSNELQGIIDSIPPDFADPGADYLAVRKMFAPYHGHPVSEKLSVNILDYGGVRCGSYILEGGQNDLIAFHCHGGALVSCPLDHYHFYAEMIAEQTGCRVVIPDYRLAPEHCYPAAHDDCFNAYCGLLESGADPARIVLMGESCGGSLAVGMLVRLREEALAMPACFVSLSGWFDLSVKGEIFSERDPFLTPEWVRNRGREYVAGVLELDDPKVSPAYAELQGLPPMYMQVGQFDTVREGAITLASNALRAGVEITLESWPGVIHGWHGLVSADVPEALDAWACIRSYIRHIARVQH